ncbi:hypothetical protein HPB51_000855 [Rhipicephalus microplus]|uniref:Transposable element P transposase-like GTP-binding insertion domain-containing protein n=1 Tax=Rhipicephalus microplus TaxID=6941 RepID=A0A9J6D819_RHIMP|nr:hypothetical protein HPB51_000855 [Rhipicephalus microplus]
MERPDEQSDNVADETVNADMWSSLVESKSGSTGPAYVTVAVHSVARLYCASSHLIKTVKKRKAPAARVCLPAKKRCVSGGDSSSSTPASSLDSRGSDTALSGIAEAISVSCATTANCSTEAVFEPDADPDAPHLIKCVRNRLLKQKLFSLNGSRVMWSHYDKLYVVDTKAEGMLRVYPKLSFSHVNPSNTEKMRMKLATQLFSLSVANGLEFYSQKGSLGLCNVKGTVDFTVRMNNLFDAFNCKYPKEGLREGRKDFSILESTLQWLYNWEKDVKLAKVNP